MFIMVEEELLVGVMRVLCLWVWLRVVFLHAAAAAAIPPAGAAGAGANDAPYSRFGREWA